MTSLTAPMTTSQVSTQPVVSLEEFARAAVEKSASASKLGRRAAAYLKSLARREHAPAGVPAVMQHAAHHALSNYDLIEDPRHEFHLPNPNRER